MKIISLIAIATTAVASLFAQESPHRCGTNQYIDQIAISHPEIKDQQQQIQHKITLATNNNQYVTDKTVRIIPIVFHVVHTGGDENISDAQILDQLNILNKAFRRKNADSTSIPVPFKPAFADANIEFRLATIDPQGNCTSGITRTISPLADHQLGPFSGFALKTNQWNPNKYFNVWIVRTLVAGDNHPLLGYASPPSAFFTAPGLDGVVVLHEAVGSIGTATIAGNPYNKGKTLVHEIGHSFGLLHIWGDAECGDDGIADTPPQRDENNACPTFPRVSGCPGANANGDMFMNYMDYTRDNCLAMFTNGQSMAMNWVLDNIRTTIWAANNLTATGVSSTSTQATNCVPKALFFAQDSITCVGNSISFVDNTYNGTPTSYQWTFQGATPSTSTASNPVVQYTAVGDYNVSLTVTNAAGTSSYTRNSYITVLPHLIANPLYQEGLENTAEFNTNWLVRNGNPGSPTWQITTNTAYTGSKSLFINSLGNIPEQQDQFQSASIDAANIPTPKLFFKLAFAKKTNTNADKLQIYLSDNCGQTWVERYSKTANSGAKLETVPTNITSPFTPSSNDWRSETVGIPSSFNKNNISVLFRFTNSGGNNIYIDDIQIADITTGITEFPINEFSIYPNPSTNGIYELTTTQELSHATITVYNTVGQIVYTKQLSKIDKKYLLDINNVTNGLYVLRIDSEQGTIIKKIIKE